MGGFSQVRARDKALERSRRALQEHGSGLSSQLLRGEDALRAVEAQLAGLKGHVAQLEDVLRQRDRQVRHQAQALDAPHRWVSTAKAGGVWVPWPPCSGAGVCCCAWRGAQMAALRRQVAQSRLAGHGAASERLRGEAANQELHEALAAVRARALALEAELAARGREADRAQRALEAAHAQQEQVRAAVVLRCTNLIVVLSMCGHAAQRCPHDVAYGVRAVEWSCRSCAAVAVLPQMHERQQALQAALARVQGEAGLARQRLLQVLHASKQRQARAQRHEAALQQARAAEHAAHERCAQVRLPGAAPAGRCERQQSHCLARGKGVVLSLRACAG